MTNEHRDHQFFFSRTSGVEKRQRETHSDERGEKHIVTNARTLSKMGFLSDRPNTFRRERLDLYWPIDGDCHSDRCLPAR